MCSPSDGAFGCTHFAAACRDVLTEKFAKIAFADKADAGGVLLRVGRQAGLACELAHLGFRQFADRKQRRRQLLLAKRVQKIALILVRVVTAQQTLAAVDAIGARIVSGRDLFRAQRARVLEKGLELDFAIAQHVGIRRASGAVFAEEILEYAVPVFRGEVARVERYAEFGAHAHRIGAVAVGLAFAETFVFDPVLHEQAGDVRSRRA